MGVSGPKGAKGPPGFPGGGIKSMSNAELFSYAEQLLIYIKEQQPRHDLPLPLSGPWRPDGEWRAHVSNDVRIVELVVEMARRLMVSDK